MAWQFFVAWRCTSIEGIWAVTDSRPLEFRTSDCPVEDIEGRSAITGRGQFLYSFSAIFEVQSSSRNELVLPTHAVWIPPGVDYELKRRLRGKHCVISVSQHRCRTLPSQVTSLGITPVLSAMFEHLRSVTTRFGTVAEEDRFLKVMLDLLSAARRVDSYLPNSADPLLGPILETLKADPSDTRTLTDLAISMGSTERTISRRCLTDLGLPFAEWRQRLRVLQAIPMLVAGETVGCVSASLGYSNASAFIAMFKRTIGTTPDHFREMAGGDGYGKIGVKK